jgi:signal transduction histidine kinase
VIVADDGVGFDAGRPKTGYGLAGMRERVALVGGTLSITSTAGGTRVEATLPLGSRARP